MLNSFLFVKALLSTVFICIFYNLIVIHNLDYEYPHLKLNHCDLAIHEAVNKNDFFIFEIPNEPEINEPLDNDIPNDNLANN
jgi:hypothetical protein